VEADQVDVYICAGGPATMCLHGQLIALGVPAANIHLEYFGPFQSPPEK